MRSALGLGEQAQPDLIEKIKELVTAPDEILGVHDLLIHDYGPGKCFASIHAEVNADLYSLEGHDIIDELESRALRELNVHLVIHYDPILVNDAEWNEMRQVTQEIIHEIDPAVTMHCFRIVGGKEQKNLVFDLMVPYEAKRPNEELKQEIDRKLRERNIKYGTVIRFDGKE